jgi:hypothetical protein
MANPVDTGPLCIERESRIVVAPNGPVDLNLLARLRVRNKLAEVDDAVNAAVTPLL